MGKLLMIAGGVADPGGSVGPTLSAYVVLSAGHLSRIFKVRGPTASAQVTELPSATTIDLKRFQRDLEEDLESLHARGQPAQIARPPEALACDRVREHLKATEGLTVD
jgi:hypothetical protein